MILPFNCTTYLFVFQGNFYDDSVSLFDLQRCQGNLSTDSPDIIFWERA